MPQLRRNHPCRCGSGKKYKKCCLSKDEAAAAERDQGLAEQTPHLHEELCPDCRDEFGVFEDEIDQLSNSVLPLIRAGRLDEG